MGQNIFATGSTRTLFGSDYSLLVILVQWISLKQSSFMDALK